MIIRKKIDSYKRRTFRRCYLLLLPILLASCQQAGQLYDSLAGSPVDSKCRELGSNYIEKAKKDHTQDYTLLKTDSFYSKSLDSCIHTEVSEVGVDFNIYDLSDSLLKGKAALLHCDAEGADSVIVEAVRKHRGYMFTVPYNEQVDD